MKKIISIIIVLVVLVLGYFALFRGADNQPIQQITIAEFGEVFLYAPLYVADAEGFFEDEGLDVSIVPTGGDEKTFAALLSGDAQFGVADPTFVAISGEKGQPGKVVAAVLSGVPFWGVAKNSSIPDINQPTQLSGYRVATFPAPSTAYTLQTKMFRNGGLQPNIREVAFGSLLAALDANEVDIALELEPNVSTAVKNGNRIVYGLPEYYPDFAITGLTALPKYIEENPETVQKVVNAFQNAMDFIQENPTETAEILVQRFPEVERDVAENAVRNMITSGVFPTDTVVSKAGWDAAIQVRRDVGDLNSSAPYENYVITNFSEQAK